MEFELEKSVKDILDRVHADGHACYLVGGAVRDLLCGRQPYDYDFTTDAAPQQLLELFSGSVLTGREYGTVTVPAGGRGFEITPFRSEEGYADGRHPDRVSFGADLHTDLSRRDFTVNAMAYDGSTVFDDWNGRGDLQNRLLRTVGDPARRFSEDGLRILRLFRFQSKLGFAAEHDTLAAALLYRDNLHGVSIERIRQELQSLLLGGQPDAIRPFLQAGGLDFLGIRADGGTPLEKLREVPCTVLLRWWAFLHLCGADESFVGRKLNFSRCFYHDMITLDVLFEPCDDKVRLKRRAAHGLPVEMGLILETFCVLDSAFEPARRAWAEVTANGEACRISELDIDGKALLSIGCRGPEVGRRMQLLLEAVIRKPELNRRETLLAMARAMEPL